MVKYHTDGSIIVNGMPGGKPGLSFKDQLKRDKNGIKRAARQIKSDVKKVAKWAWSEGGKYLKK